MRMEDTTRICHRHFIQKFGLPFQSQIKCSLGLAEEIVHFRSLMDHFHRTRAEYLEMHLADQVVTWIVLA